ncbi:hypothetical protein QNH44_23070 [Cytobacillus firmus]|uniref:hypothetical protein n=1 Tax=Cytobacillus firmus TaxID=1399 RepID=UPI0024C1A208|nr:hypothetical protein [Cytobacillus firmus]WHY33855.1 hypothetical protein QNH44_23070 [Cytobacillus firmus]
MVKASINNLVGIAVDDSYPWIDTLFISTGVASLKEEDYEKCSAHIFIKKTNNLNISDCRDIGGEIFISHHTIVDTRYGVRIDRNDSRNITLTVTQECNEWLTICLQLLLLELDCTLIHAAALEKDGDVILLPSWGGVGKTATVIKMISEGGWKLLGDDLVILNGSQVEPFLKPFVIYPYHQSLFPDIFRQHKGKVVTNLTISKLMSKAIPFAKKIMRPIPRLLAFARKYNPQSMRVSPMRIFKKEELSKGGVLKKVIWLERTVGENTDYYQENIERIVSKTASVSIMELLGDRITCVFSLYGAGVFDYHKTNHKMYELILKAYKKLNCYELDIPTSVPIHEVGSVVLNYVINENNKESFVG